MANHGVCFAALLPLSPAYVFVKHRGVSRIYLEKKNVRRSLGNSTLNFFPARAAWKSHTICEWFTSNLSFSFVEAFRHQATWFSYGFRREAEEATRLT